MAFLDNPVAIIITTSLVIQITVFFLLVFGYLMKKKLKYREHGIVMTVAVVLHLITVFSVMIPALIFSVIPDYIIPSPLGMTSIIGIIHGILGAIALTVGIWLVASWRFSKNVAGCISRKRFMLKTLIVWIFSLTFGLILYSIFIGPVLMS